MKQEDRVGSICGALKAKLKHADSGTLAALRRARIDSPPREFFRVATKVLDEAGVFENGSSREAAEKQWLVVTSAIARGIVDERTNLFSVYGLGESLALAKLSEQRLTRLLQASGEGLHDAVRVAVHYLVSKGISFSPTALARLVVSDGKVHGRGVRQRIARDYYRLTDAGDASTSDKKATA